MYVIDGKLGFIGHPRTASRSIATALEVKLGAKRVRSHHQVDEEAVTAIYQAGGHVACVTRNMFDLLVSWFHNVPTTEAGKDFDAFVRKLIDNPSQRWFRPLLYHYGLGYCDRIIRYDHLESQFDYTLREAGLKSVNLPLVGESLDRKAYRDYYTPSLQSAVEDRWADDLFLTGAKF